MAADQERVWSPSPTPTYETEEPISTTEPTAPAEAKYALPGEAVCNLKAEPPSAPSKESDTALYTRRRSGNITGQGGPSIQQVYNRYLDDPSVVRSTKTLLAYRSAYGRLIELISPEMPIKAITREVCRDVLDTLRYLPPNATKRYPRLSGREAAIRARAEGLAPISALTINGHIQKLSALLTWAVNEGYIDRNPARGLKVIDKVRRKDKRYPFSSEQLSLIFNAPLYRGCQDDGPGYAQPGPNRPRRGRFWVPLIGLFSGMRLNEICQLDLADVRLIDGINCFVVTAGGLDCPTDKRLKTENAERVVPIHPSLVGMGFLDYVQARRVNRDAKLFPELPIACTGYYSDTFSKWFANFLQKTGAKAPRTSFHSFRHNFRDALREARVEKEVAYALGGWAGDGPDDGSATAENYGRGFSIATLEEAVAKVNYPDLNLGYLISLHAAV
ncbi:tyrosine-type recombinase/integrase [Microvirga sp. M2]|uniref:site-specific integrase n=1 Tax=Microvirga sp. M2 TaxID=3073270 RepID=UPI0039C11603